MLLKILIAFCVESSLLVIVSFAFFAANHYCNDDKAEKVFILSLGILGILVMIASTIGIFTS